MPDYACRKCKFINHDTLVCKNCGSTDLTKEWYGYIVIIDPENSQIAQKLGIKIPGKYTIKVD
ncbi:DNA-directed RNA polymerase subunit E'' [Archaeoglobales archaeon]|jgi:DNA-directed RNA polymerase subunit E"|nr:MAG: DNA-directed RNA polymerase subunit E'' [Archaeoglobales archaeon]